MFSWYSSSCVWNQLAPIPNCSLRLLFLFPLFCFKIILLLFMVVLFSPPIVNKCIIRKDFTARACYKTLSFFKLNDLGVKRVQAEALREHRKEIF